MLGDIDRGTAVLSPERQSLEDADQQQDDRRRHADGRIGRQHADERRRAAHDQERDEERVLAADQVADPTEEQRAERPDDKADRERRQVGNQRQGLVALGIEQRCDDGGETSKNIEVVPLDHRSDGRGGDHFGDAVVGTGHGGDCVTCGVRRAASDVRCEVRRAVQSPMCCATCCATCDVRRATCYVLRASGR